MAVSGRLRHRLVPLLRSERGQALPTALFAMIASFALASAAVLSSVDVQQGSARDHNSKEAIAAADAGAGVALVRLNRFQRNFKTAQCVGPNGEEQTPTNGWCPATSAESVGGSTFSYQVSAYEGGNKEVSVVAVGTSGSVSRRVEVGLVSYGGKELLAHEPFIGKNGIETKGNAYIHTNIGTNGDVTINSENGKSAEICGEIRVGAGQAPPPKPCNSQEYPTTEGNQNLPGIAVPEDLWTHNSDCRLVPNCAKAEEVDTYTISGKTTEKTRTATNPWDATKKWINVSNNASLTMGGENYLVCGLKLEGSGKLIMANLPNSAQVQIFVDTPEHCGLEPGATQVEITGNANIVSTGYNPAEGKYSVPGIYLLGNGAVKLDGNSGTNELLLYAPESNVEVKGNTTWYGDIAGKTLTFSGGPTLESNPGIGPSEETIQKLWARTHYVECTGLAGSAPNASC